MSPWRIAALLGTVLALLCLVTGVVVCFGNYIVGSVSMADTLLQGDRILVDEISARLGRGPQFGDMVVMRYPLNRLEVYMKRIEGVPGDRLRIVNKQFYRNGAAITEPYIKHIATYVDAYRDNFPSTPSIPVPPAVTAMLRDDVNNGDLVIPNGRYFVMGDNRDDSSDSRYWGYILQSDIIGRPVLIYLSLDPETGNIRRDRYFKPL